MCFGTNQVDMQPGSYFGISAATGERSPDIHEIYDFKVTPLDAAPAESLSPPAATPAADHDRAADRTTHSSVATV
jgi:Legume-like lectin family